MYNKKISVIIPIYNEEKNIYKCVKNLVAQTTPDFHVVFINDGSTDKSLQVLNNTLSTTNPNFSFEIISQKNSGAAKARESGINHSTSEYVMVFDCDDSATNDYIECTLRSLLHTNADISLPKMRIEQIDGNFKDFIFYDKRPEYTGKECLEYSLGRWKVHGVMCAKKSLFLKSYDTYKTYNPMDVNYINNDEIIARLNFYHSNKVVKNNGTYSYLNNLESTTKKINENSYLMCKNAQILYDLFGKNMGQISKNTQQELVETMWRTLKYAIKNKHLLSNTLLWKQQIIATLRFINLHKKNMSLSFKNKTRILKAHIYLLAL